MKIKISIIILALALLVGCSQTEKENVTESQSQTKISETTTRIEEATTVFEDETVCPTQIENQNQGLKAETKTIENSKEKVVPSTKESTTRLENITELKENLPPTTTQTTTTELITEPTTAKPFDINYYVNFAKSYALSLGFSLDPTATACWDNPIAAGPNGIYTERDIKNYLNMYSRMDDVTNIWIWPEQLNENEYLIYIGYA